MEQHEQFHIAFPPKHDDARVWLKEMTDRNPDLPIEPMDMQAAEDFRVNNLGLLKVGKVLGLGAKHRVLAELGATIPIAQVKKGIEFLRATQGMAAAVQAVIGAASYYGGTAAISKRATAAVKEVVEKADRIISLAYRRSRHGFAEHTFTEIVAYEIAKLRVPPEPKPREGDPDEEEPGSKTPEDTETVGFGPLRVHTPSLTTDCAGAKGYRATDDPSDGAVRYPHKWKPWQGEWKVFRRRHKRKPRASILFDWSGSMSWEDEQVARCLAESPANTIGVYSGKSQVGDLVVLAEGGKSYHTLDQGRIRSDFGGMGFGNVVDGPALEWLARQPGPRIWVSDGGVTGIGEECSYKLRQQCEELCRKHGITMFNPDQVGHDNLIDEITKLSR